MMVMVKEGTLLMGFKDEDEEADEMSCGNAI